MKALSVQFSMAKKLPDVKVYFPDKKVPTIWHISFKGAKGSEFEGGIYHFSMDLTQYPRIGPVTYILTNSGVWGPN